MTASGPNARTASVSASASKTLQTTGSAPSAASWPILSRDRVMPATTWPARTRSGTRRTPMTPLAPARKTRIVVTLSVIFGPEACANQIESGDSVLVERAEQVLFDDLPERAGLLHTQPVEDMQAVGDRVAA